MRVIAAVVAIVTAGTAAGPAVAAPSGSATRQPGSCGWFAVLGCFSNREAAWRRNDELETGYVIDTAAARNPAFRPGFYCVVKGPLPRREAEGWRRIVPGAYPKRSC